MKQILSTCSFGMADQHSFAQLSGDANPVHLDALFVRRTLFGKPVVHGMHLLLRTLDHWIANSPPAAAGPVTLRRLRGRFPSPAFVGEEVEIRLVSQLGGHAKFQAISQGFSVLQLELEWGYERQAALRPLPRPSADDLARVPRVLSLEEVEGCVGTLSLWCDPAALASSFPELARRVGARQLAGLLACSRLVGMECPGLHSIFSTFDLTRREPELDHDYFDYCVGEVSENASLAQIDISSSGFRGRLQALRRPEAPAPPSFEEVGLYVGPFEFRDQVALVVGGSRGIGAVTAKLIAAGGGRVVATYQRGERDALELAREIRAGGGLCDVVHCDAANPGKTFEWLESHDISPNHVYYFASPPNFAKRSRSYSQELYQRLAATYVDGFIAVLLAFQQLRPEGINAFYPSSVILDEPTTNLPEYRDAKRAGEQLCREFDDADVPIRVRVARLPRIDTDQTISLRRVPASNALDVMLEELRSLQELTHA
jgi:NAD(P)-dependent dehydrogenase (short-subunit alcohol dehydrogenase family)